MAMKDERPIQTRLSLAKQAKDLRDQLDKAAQASLGPVIEAANRQLDQLRKFMSLESATSRQLDQLRKFMSLDSNMRSIQKQMELFDRNTPHLIRGIEAGLAVNAAKLAFPNSALESWRIVMASQQTLARLQANMPASLNSGVLDDLARSTSVSEQLTHWASSMSPGSAILRGITRPSLTEFNSYLTDARLDHREHAMFALRASQSVSGLLSGELLTGDLTVHEDEAVTKVEVEVVEPWRAAPAMERQRLLSVLSSLDPAIPELLDGAWDEATNPGPAAKSKLANCAVEALDRALRSAAPDADIQTWSKVNDVEIQTDDRGRPTRATRIRYVLRNRKGDRPLILAQTENLVLVRTELSERLQGAKHSSASTLEAAKAYLLVGEALLYQLFLVNPGV